MKPIIDISSHQDPERIDYNALAGAIDGAILRACYGSRPDTAFDQHYGALTERGLPTGAYIYLTEYQPIENQVQTLLKAIQGKTLALGIWIDVELEEGATPLTKQTVHRAIQLIEAAIGQPVGIYTSAYYWGLIMGGVYYNTRKLWAAHFGVTTPNLPTGWSTWTLHQHTSSGRLPGYNRNLDVNRFNGTKAQYQAWINGDPGEVETPPPPLTRLNMPVYEGARISQYFGANPSWYPTSRGHNGIDFAILAGTPVTAAESGIVEVAQAQVNGYGRHVRIRHSHGVTIYGHLSKLQVSVGDTVSPGQVIGLSGGDPSDPYSGFTTGQHLHFEYRLDIPAPQVPGGYVYNAVDPLPLLLNNEETDMLYEVRIIVDALRVRTGPGLGYYATGLVFKNQIKAVYQETGDWLRIGTGQWICGQAIYVEKITPPALPEPPAPDLEQRVSALEERVTVLENN